MNRETAISLIENLYPPDSEYFDSAAIGQRLLDQAKREVAAWKQEPTPVLVRFAQLCMEEEAKEI